MGGTRPHIRQSRNRVEERRVVKCIVGREEFTLYASRLTVFFILQFHLMSYELRAMGFLMDRGKIDEKENGICPYCLIDKIVQECTL